MNKILFIKDYLKDGFPLNLVFSSDSVTVRTFSMVQTANAEDEKGLAEYKKKKSSALKSSLLTRDSKNYVGKYFSIEKNLYKVENQLKIPLSKQIWKTNNEVDLAIAGVHGEDGVAFIDRNASTAENQESFSSFNKRMQVSGLRIAFRWLVLPKSNLLTAPMLAEPTGDLRVITNIKLGKPIFTSNERRLTSSQKQKADKSSREFQEYWKPSLTIKGPNTIKAGGIAEFSIVCQYSGGNTLKVNHEYAIHAVSGYAPHTRVSVINGLGKFRLMALGLSKGETMRFKINDWNWSGKTEKSLKVV